MFTSYKHTINVKWLDRIVAAPIIGVRGYDDMVIHTLHTYTTYIYIYILYLGKFLSELCKVWKREWKESGLPKTASKMESTLGKIFPIKCELFAEHKKYINWWLTTFLRFYYKPLPPAYKIYIYLAHITCNSYMHSPKWISVVDYHET